ncbi:hypothetical protein [Psychrobacillus vulpis]|uniref:hypothetical protein n=1 Tax=Psychrobacillus vulpis TaxID=2325572 RepID=UPI0014092425|nr:hypothetical protein [Psychrobacillus vulpis]
MENIQPKFTVVGTKIEEVKKQNANSGLTYNELNEWFAKQIENERNNTTSYTKLNEKNQ